MPPSAVCDEEEEPLGKPTSQTNEHIHPSAGIFMYTRRFCFVLAQKKLQPCPKLVVDSITSRLQWWAISPLTTL